MGPVNADSSADPWIPCPEKVDAQHWHNLDLRQRTFWSFIIMGELGGPEQASSEDVSRIGMVQELRAKFCTEVLTLDSQRAMRLSERMICWISHCRCASEDMQLVGLSVGEGPAYISRIID